MTLGNVAARLGYVSSQSPPVHQPSLPFLVHSVPGVIWQKGEGSRSFPAPCSASIRKLATRAIIPSLSLFLPFLSHTQLLPFFPLSLHAHCIPSPLLPPSSIQIGRGGPSPRPDQTLCASRKSGGVKRHLSCSPGESWGNTRESWDS